jgi:hypothetical protein
MRWYLEANARWLLREAVRVCELPSITVLRGGLNCTQCDTRIIVLIGAVDNSVMMSRHLRQNRRSPLRYDASILRSSKPRIKCALRPGPCLVRLDEVPCAQYVNYDSKHTWCTKYYHESQITKPFYYTPHIPPDGDPWVR